MKIRLLTDMGSAKHGDIVDAIIPKNDNIPTVFYDTGDLTLFVYKPNYEIVKESEVESNATVLSVRDLSVRDLLDQDIKTLEFK